MKLREQLSNSEIAKRTGLSRNTVKKWLKAPGDQAPKYKRQSGFTKLSAFEAPLVQALKADSHRPKHARRSARALLAQLQAQGYRGGYSRLTDFIRAWREQEGKAASLMASPNSPTRGHPKFPQAAQPDYDVSRLTTKRAAASLSL